MIKKLGISSLTGRIKVAMKLDDKYVSLSTFQEDVVKLNMIRYSNKAGEITPAFTCNTSSLCISDLILNYTKPMCLIMLMGALTGVRVICCSICPKVGAAVNTAT